MLATIWGSLKAATWAQRGILLGVFLGIIASVYLVGYLKGQRSCEEDHAQAALEQAIDAKEHGAEQDAVLDKLTERHEQQDRAAAKSAEVVTKEIVRYVETTRPVALDPEYQRLLHELQRLQRDAENRVLRTHATPREVDAVSPEGLTSNQLLQAYDELTKARNEDLGIVALCQDFETTRYTSEWEFYHGEKD